MSKFTLITEKSMENTPMTGFSNSAAKPWLRSFNTTCSQVIEGGHGWIPEDVTTIHSKHLIQPGAIGADPLKGVNLILDSMDARAKISNRSKALIRENVSSALSSLKDSRPEGTTPAQWAAVLTETADSLRSQMFSEGTNPFGPGGRQNKPDVDPKSRCTAKAELVSTQPPNDRYRVTKRTSHTGANLSYWIEAYGELRNGDKTDDEYRRTSSKSSCWIPVDRNE